VNTTHIRNTPLPKLQVGHNIGLYGEVWVYRGPNEWARIRGVEGSEADTVDTMDDWEMTAQEFKYFVPPWLANPQVRPGNIVKVVRKSDRNHGTVGIVKDRFRSEFGEFDEPATVIIRPFSLAALAIPDSWLVDATLAEFEAYARKEVVGWNKSLGVDNGPRVL